MSRHRPGVQVAFACLVLLGCQAAPQITSIPTSPTPIATVATPPPSTSAPTAPATADSRAVIGSWEVLEPEAPISAIHAALLHTGKVWLGTGSDNEETMFDAGNFRSATWDPASGAFTEVPTPWDVFCAGHSFLADGRLLLTGGTLGYPTEDSFFQGSPRAYLFDPAAERYERTADMRRGRWYPTNVTLPTGRVYVVAGFDETGHRQVRIPEIFDPASETWSRAPGEISWPLYPALFQTLEPGVLFYSGGNVFGNKGLEAGLLDIASGNLTPVGGPSEPEHRDQSASVLLPPAQEQRVMIIGGGSPLPPNGDGIGVANVDIIDLDTDAPAYVAAPPLSEPRMHVSAVLLPDRTVLASGGGRVREGNAVNTGEIFDPLTESWRTVAEAQVDRLYHSFSLLLPDGRVLAGGSNPGEGIHEHRLEIYSPPYLFGGPRPVIETAPESATYGQLINIQATPADQIAQMSLMRPGAVTHSMDTEQRLVDVPFTNQGDQLELQMPGEPTLAPPGWYMLFAVSDDGVPSIAAWIRLGA